VKTDLGTFQHGLGFTRDGSYYYSVSAWVNDVYLATLDTVARKISSPKKVVSHVGFGTSTDWSPDGQYLAYVSGTGWLYEPFVLGMLAIETGKKSGLQLSGIERYGDQVFQPHWSPDGRFVLAGGDVLGRPGLYRIDAHTGEVNFTSNGDPRWSTWSPDGQSIFTRRMTETETTVIVMRHPTTGQERELYRVASPVRLSNLVASPDARRLAFVSRDEQGQTIEVTSIVGGEAPRQVIRLPARANAALALAWTPSSRDIVYAYGFGAADEKPALGLWLISADGGVPTDLGVTMNALPFGLSVHRDGRRIAFTAGTRRHPEVWVLKNLLR
jgi:Tol biopolymer transport system component